MTPEGWARVRELFLAATELAQDERRAWLAGVCADEPAVRAEVERLLAEDAASTGFLESPVVPPAAPDEASLIGTRVGRYTLLSVIASGGMGTVFEARQDQPRRTVALKMLRRGLATPSRLRRFQVEAEVLGSLAHPGIAQIFEAGTYEGQPFFAMEYVVGARDLIVHAREERLTRAQRVRLFAGFCDAVSHGHQKGVIHRDLKPSNLLVGAAGEPKVIDFGVARAARGELDSTHTFETRAGQIVGTLQYMSPEQLIGDPRGVDVRSDVYALGCVLYQLVTGELPYDLEDLPLAAVAQHVAVVEPRRHPELQGDLRWIVSKALEKAPEQRYASASELRADLERFLANEPVLAGPPSRSYLLRKFVRRHRAAVLAVLAVIAALSFGLVRARVDALAAQRARGDAEREAAKARSVTRFLRRVLTSVAPQDMGLEVRVVDVLDDASRSAEQDPGDDPEVRAIVQQVLGESYLALGRLELAEGHLQRARTLFEGATGPDDPQRIEVLASWAALLMERRRLSEAEALTAVLLPRAQALLGPQDPCVRRIRRTRTWALTALDRGTEAEALALESLERTRTTPAEDPQARIANLTDLAKVRGAQGRFQEASELLEQALAESERELPPDHFLTQATLLSLGAAYFDLARWPEAEACNRASLEWFRKALGSEHDSTLAAVNNLATAVMMQGRIDEALVLIQEALGIARRLHGERSVSMVSALANLAVAHLKLEEHEQAEAVCLEALRLAEGLLPDDHDLLLRVRMNLGMAMEAQGRLEEAEQIFLLDYEQSRATLGPGHPVTLAHLARLVYVNVLSGEPQEVVTHATELLEHGRKIGRYVEWCEEQLEQARASLDAPGN